MRTTLVALALLVLAPVPPASAETGRQPAAVEILNKANEAAARLTALSYQAAISGEGALAGRVANMRGQVIARKPKPDARQTQIRIEAESIIRLGDTTTAPAVTQPFKFVSDGRTANFLDERAKSFATGDTASAANLSIQALFPPRFMRKGAFSDELAGQNLQHQGHADVEGVPCDIVEVEYERVGTRSAKFFFGTKDSLLRRIESKVVFRMSGPSNQLQTGTLIFQAHQLNSTPETSDAVFRLECPPGYRRDSLRPPVQASQGPLTIGSEAPDWELNTPDGRSVSLKSLRGKIVVLDFWATWCGPCKMAMPAIQKLHERFKDKPVAVYGVNCWERNPRANPADLPFKMGLTYGQLLAGDRVAVAYGVSAIPTLCVIGKDGKILTVMRGFSQTAEQQLTELIQQNLTH